MALDAKPSLFVGQQNILVIAGMGRMAARADQPSAGLGIDKALPHRVHVCLVGIMALQAQLYFVVACKQAGVI